MRNIIEKVLCLIWLASNIGCSSPQKSVLKTGLEGQELPSFSLLLADSTTYFNTAKLPRNKPVVFLFFSPSCPYCRAQTEEIIENIKSLNEVEFCILTFAPYKDFKNFSDEFNLDRYSNIIAGVDYTNFFLNYFKAQSVPYLAFYNKQKRLKQVTLGNLDNKELKTLALSQ